MSYAAPERLRHGDREGALEGLRRIFHPAVGLTGALLHLGITEEWARDFTAAVEEGRTLVMVIPGTQGPEIERIFELHGAERVSAHDAAGRGEVAIDRPGGPLEPRFDPKVEETHNPDVARALGTYEGELMAETTDHLEEHG